MRSRLKRERHPRLSCEELLVGIQYHGRLVTFENVPARGSYIGLFMVALATLMYEILLARIFSVTMLYHFSFVALSVAMFGMTVGALIVYLSPSIFTPARLQWWLAVAALLFPIVIV